MTLWATIYFNADHLLGIYEYVAGELSFVLPVLNQNVLMTWWMLITMIIMSEVALCMYKLFEGQWTKKVVLFQAGHEILTTAKIIFLFTRPTIFNKDFLVYMANAFNTTTERFVNNSIFWFLVLSILFSLLTVYDAWKKAQLPSQLYYKVNERVQFIKNRGSL